MSIHGSAVDDLQRNSGMALKLLAFERLLNDYPGFRGRVVLVLRSCRPHDVYVPRAEAEAEAAEAGAAGAGTGTGRRRLVRGATGRHAGGGREA